MNKKEYQKQWRDRNKDKIIIYRRSEESRLRQKCYYKNRQIKKTKEHRDAINKRSREAYALNKESINKRRREIYKEKIKDNSYREYVKNRSKKSKPIIVKKNKISIEERRIRQNEQRKKRILKDPIYKLKECLSAHTKRFIKKHTSKIKPSEVIGASADTVRSYLESKFSEGMGWDNHGKFGWHIDHIIPLSSAKTEEELIKLYHYTNLQPLWWQENLKKHKKNPLAFLKQESTK